MTSLTKEACAPLGVKPRDADRSKNLFALGLISWMYTRPEQPTIDWISEKFAKRPQVRDANLAAFRAGHAFGETAELFDHPYQVLPAPQKSGTYTNITGNTALAWGLVAAGQLAQLPVFLGSYPITPASDILHELSKHKNFGVRTLQAEDEIAGIGAALGASYGGHLGVTTTSGPGVALKSETIGLAISLELPLLIIDIQRGGPSTGLPTKTEQSDLLLAMYGHHGESPLPDRGRLQPLELLRGGHRGGPPGPDLPHPGDPAVRRLPGQRVRALVAARRRVAGADRGHLRHRAQPRQRRGRARVLALPARSRDAGPAAGPARHPRPDAPHRRHREGGRERQHQLRPGQPRAHGRPAGGQDRRHRPGPAAGRGDRRRRRRRAADRGVGVDLGRHQRRRRPGARPAGARWPRST